MREGMARLKQPRRSQSVTNPSPIRTKEEEEEEDEDEEEEDSLASGENMKNSFRSLGLPKANISIVYYKDEMEEEEEVEMDLEIGSPTDVKHATHANRFGWFCFKNITCKED